MSPPNEENPMSNKTRTDAFPKPIRLLPLTAAIREAIRRRRIADAALAELAREHVRQGLVRDGALQGVTVG